jgi:hypothetical protein
LSPYSAKPLVISLRFVPVLRFTFSFSFSFEFLDFALFGVLILRRTRLSRFDLDGLLIYTQSSYVVERFFSCNSFLASRMVVTRAGDSTCTNPYLPSPNEGPQVAENPRRQDLDDITNSVTREASDSAPPVPSGSVCGPFMDHTYNVEGEAYANFPAWPLCFS